MFDQFWPLSHDASRMRKWWGFFCFVAAFALALYAEVGDSMKPEQRMFIGVGGVVAVSLIYSGGVLGARKIRPPATPLDDVDVAIADLKKLSWDFQKRSPLQVLVNFNDPLTNGATANYLASIMTMHGNDSGPVLEYFLRLVNAGAIEVVPRANGGTVYVRTNLGRRIMARIGDSVLPEIILPMMPPGT